MTAELAENIVVRARRNDSYQFRGRPD
jgi:hypothetical protein